MIKTIKHSLFEQDPFYFLCYYRMLFLLLLHTKLFSFHKKFYSLEQQTTLSYVTKLSHYYTLTYVIKTRKVSRNNNRLISLEKETFLISNTIIWHILRNPYVLKMIKGDDKRKNIIRL